MPTINRKKKKHSNANTLSIKKKERQKVYNNSRWVSLRKSKIMNNPLCEDCLRENKVTPATEVHHNVSFMSTEDPIKRDSLAYDYDNLVSLCTYHHKLRHGTIKPRQDGNKEI